MTDLADHFDELARGLPERGAEPGRARQPKRRPLLRPEDDILQPNRRPRALVTEVPGRRENLWSPDDDTPAYRVPGGLRGLPLAKPSRGGEFRATVRLGSARGGKTQILSWTDPGTWTPDDLAQIAALARLTAEGAAGDWPDEGDWSEGLRKLAKFLRGANQTQLGEQYANVLNEGARRWAELHATPAEAQARELADVLHRPGAPRAVLLPKEIEELVGQFQRDPARGVQIPRDMFQRKVDSFAQGGGLVGGSRRDTESALRAHITRMVVREAQSRPEATPIFGERALTQFYSTVGPMVNETVLFLRGVADDVRLKAANAFSRLRLWDDGGAPPHWLSLGGAGSWLEDPPKGQKVRRWFDKLPGGCCGLKALARAGVPFKHLRGEDPGEWEGAPLSKMVSFLEGHGLAYAFHDGLGRSVLRSETARQKERYRFVAACGHVTAFTSKKQAKALELVGDPKGPEGVLHFVDQVFGLRGVSTLEANTLYENCGLRAARYGRAPGEGDLVLDINKAYPSLLTDERCIFPKAEGPEVIRDFPDGAPPTGREKLKRTGFYLVDMPDISAEAKKLLGAPDGRFWFYGDALFQAFPDEEAFRVLGAYEPGGSAKGLPLDTPPEGEDPRGEGLAALRPRIGAWMGLEDFPPPVEVAPGIYDDPDGGEAREEREKTVRKLTYLALTHYSGFLESARSQKKITTVPTHKDEVAWFKATSRLFGDSQPMVLQAAGGRMEVEFVRSRIWKTTGRLAKLALYAYTKARLIRMAEQVRSLDPRAVLTYSATDSVGFRTILRPGGPLQGLGPQPGQFKVSRGPRFREGSPDDEEPPSTSGTGSRLGAPKAEELTLGQATARVERGSPGGLMILGPPGTGKTRWVKETLIPSLIAQGINYSLCTQMKAHANRIGAATSERLLSPNLCFEATSRSLENSVLIVDEAGQASPAQIHAFSKVRARGLILVGDSNQLSSCGDLEALAGRLNLQVVRVGFHEKDRYGGCPRMRGVLSLLEEAIAQDRERGLHQTAEVGAGTWPEGLEADLEAAGLPFADDPPDDLEKWAVLGWRHRYVDAYEGVAASASTVHASQGSTLEGRILITDFKCDPRLLYVAVSRARSLEQLRVLRAPRVAPPPGPAPTPGN